MNVKRTHFSTQWYMSWWIIFELPWLQWHLYQDARIDERSGYFRVSSAMLWCCIKFLSASSKHKISKLHQRPPEIKTTRISISKFNNASTRILFFAGTGSAFCNVKMASSVNISNRSNGKILLRRPNTVFSDSDSDSELSLSLIDARVDSLDDSPQFMGADIPETVSEKTVSKTFESRGISTPDCPVQGPQERHRQVVTKRKKQKKKVDIKYSIPLHFLDFALTVFSTGVFLFDFGMDIVVASEYLNHKRWVPFGFTTGFIVVPAILSNGQSLRWYLIDYADEKEKLKKNPKTRKTPLCVWICRIIFTFPFMMGPVVR